MKKIITVFLPAFVLLNACMNGHRVKGDGNMTTKTIRQGDFNGVELNSSFDVYLTQGSEAGVRIEAEQNILSYIDVHVENGVLKIGSKENVWLDPGRTVKIYITAPSYNSIQNTGSGSVTGQTKITNDTKLKLGQSGSGELSLDVDAPEITADISGSGTVTLSGETKKISAVLTGSGDIKAFDLKSEESHLQMTGSGDIEIYASVELDVRITGSGDIHYKGSPQVKSNITGSGEVTKVD